MKTFAATLILLAACGDDAAVAPDAAPDAPTLPTFVPCRLVDVRNGGAMVDGRCVQECVPPRPAGRPGGCDGRVTLADGSRPLVTCYGSWQLTPGLPDYGCCFERTDDMILTSYYLQCGQM